MATNTLSDCARVMTKDDINEYIALRARIERRLGILELMLSYDETAMLVWAEFGKELRKVGTCHTAAGEWTFSFHGNGNFSLTTPDGYVLVMYTK